MSQSATLATQNEMTTCLETFEKERFCSFPHRHGDVCRKPETLSARYQPGWNVTGTPATHSEKSAWMWMVDDDG